MNGPPDGRRPVVVELAGIPGSGKSRLARTLAQQLAERGVPVTQPQVRMSAAVPTVQRLTRKALACGTTVAVAPRQTALLAQATLASRQPSLGDAAGRLVQLLVALEVAERSAHRPGVNLVDEGLVQALWSSGLRGDVSGVLARLEAWRGGPAADLLVVLRVPLDVALARLTTRTSQHSRTQSLEGTARLAELERGVRLLDELVDWWAARSPGGRGVCVVTRPEGDGNEREQLLDRICALLDAPVT